MDNKHDANNSTEPVIIRNEKVITPLNPDITVEEPVQVNNPQQNSSVIPNIGTRVQSTQSPYQALSTDTKLPSTPLVSDTPQAEKFNSSLYWAGKTIKLIFAAIAGFFITGSYYAYWDGTDILNRGQIYAKHYSPFILSETLVLSAVIILLYGLLLRFVLRSKKPFLQALTAVTISQLAVVLMLGLIHYGDKAINIVGGMTSVPIILTIMIGVSTFGLTNYCAEKVWGWRISRLSLSLLATILLFVSGFAVSKSIETKYNSRKQQEVTVSDKAKKESSEGVYNFDADYQQFFLGDTSTNRYSIEKIFAPALVPSEDSKNEPHYTQFILKDKNYTGNNKLLTITLEQFKVPASYNPPNNCGHPESGMDYFEQINKTDTYKGSCNLVKTLPGKGDLYGRQESKYKKVSAEDKAKGIYDWYYIKYGDTLITLDAIGTLNGEDVSNLFSNLKPITASELLVKSKAMTQKK